MNIEQHILCAAARTRLSAGDQARLTALLRDPVDWEYLWAQGHLHEVLPLLAVSLRPLRDQAPIPSGWLARAQRRCSATLMRNFALAEELARVCQALGDAGVTALAIKGVVLAEQLYGSLALRPAADLDVLVRPADLPRARAVLRDLDFAPAPAPAEPHHAFHDPQYFRERPGGAVCLELHWALWDARLFPFDGERLWARAAPARVNGLPVRTLSPEDTLLHLAIHRARAPLRLRLVCDIAELLRRHADRLDWDELLGQGRAAGARMALFSALSLAERLLGAPLPPVILPRLGVGALRRRALDRACGAAALFRPAAKGNLAQWPRAPLRAFVLDDSRQMLRELAQKLVRTGWRRLQHAGAAER